VSRTLGSTPHELSHGLLLHPPGVAIDKRGCRDWDQEVELEANWLAGALLISDEAALIIVRRGLTLAQAAEVYGVSEAMVRFRLNVTAAVVRINRQRRYG
jgi:Zn-dependent peptidase ImmA (M78 family)